MQLLCGAAERVTTPKLGLDIPGYFGARKATGVKSDLYTQALVLDDGNEVLVLISIDILDFISPFSRAVRKRLFEQIGVSPDHVMLLATHAHTAQPTNYTGFAVKKNTAAMKRLEDLTVEAAVEAYQNRRAVRMFAGKGEVQGISFVRNYWLKDGKGITNPGKSRAGQLAGRMAEIDQEVTVLRFEAENGDTVAHIVNFACHPDVVSGSEYCADYPGEMRRVVKANYGQESVVLFMNGCAGNINHIDAYRTTEGYRYPKDHYVYMGEVLAAEVLRIDKEASAEQSGVTLSATSKSFLAKRRQPTSEMLKEAREALASPDAKKEERIYAEERLALAAHPQHYKSIEVQAMRIGACGLVGLPGEIYCDVGLAIKAQAPYTYQLVCELANTTAGYVVTEPAFSQNVYEAKLGKYNSYLSPDAAEKMVAVAGKLLKRIK